MQGCVRYEATPRALTTTTPQGPQKTQLNTTNQSETKLNPSNKKIILYYHGRTNSGTTILNLNSGNNHSDDGTFRHGSVAATGAAWRETRGRFRFY